MHCRECDVLLTDFESTRKTDSGEYLDLCNDCFRPLRKFVKVRERFDLLRKKDVIDLDTRDIDDDDDTNETSIST